MSLTRDVGQGAAVPVQAFPPDPQPDRTYVFSGVERSTLTGRNHGLHKYPAKFIPQIPQWALTYGTSIGRDVVLDPFCGSGTTLVEAGFRGAHSLALDISPVAALITRAKTSYGESSWASPAPFVRGVLEAAEAMAPSIEHRLTTNDSDLGLGETWPYWFSARSLSRLIAIRLVVEASYAKDQDIGAVLLAVLSSVVKSASRLDEDQIKVRFDAVKTPVDPLEAFFAPATAALQTQAKVGCQYRDVGATFDVRVGSATELPWKDGVVDRVVTSPPYINAVDYTMAHKYSMFILGLVTAADFKEHCRTYVGMTERAVRAADLQVRPETGVDAIDEQAHALWDLKTPVARNRAFVVAQYFEGMLAAFKEMRRVLRPGGRVVMVAGDNRVCGLEVPTAAILEELASQTAFSTHLRFYHELANRSSMRLNRSETGGKLNRETVLVLDAV